MIKGIIPILFFFGGMAKGEIHQDFYSQTVYLHKFENLITQNRLNFIEEKWHYEPYAGIFWDSDQKTDEDEAFTDAQISPYLGVRTKVWGNEWMYSRLFSELRLVHRTKSFPDDRARTTYEGRIGLYGHALKPMLSPGFLENYYAIFYSKIYGGKLIFQGWARQGLRFRKFDLFNEIFGDTFDQTRDRQGTLDLRPGLRYNIDFKGGGIQLIYQWIHHFTNLEFAGRNESRSTLVIGYYW